MQAVEPSTWLQLLLCGGRFSSLPRQAYTAGSVRRAPPDHPLNPTPPPAVIYVYLGQVAILLFKSG